MLIFPIRYNSYYACRIQEHCDDSNDIDNDAEQTSSVRKKASHSSKEMMPPTIECILTRDLMQSVRPGESIIVTGVLRGVATSGGVREHDWRWKHQAHEHHWEPRGWHPHESRYRCYWDSNLANRRPAPQSASTESPRQIRSQTCRTHYYHRDRWSRAQLYLQIQPD